MTEFFNACLIHEDAKKNEKNVFLFGLLRRHLSSLPYSSPFSPSLTGALNIRRYVYHDVVRLGDADKLMDCAHVQLQHILRTGCKLSKYLRKCEFLALSEPGLDDGQMTPDSVLEPTGSVRTESGSSNGIAAGLSECPALTSTATTEIVRKKRSTLPGIGPRSHRLVDRFQKLTGGRGQIGVENFDLPDFVETNFLCLHRQTTLPSGTYGTSVLPVRMVCLSGEEGQTQPQNSALVGS
ncbi:hypothetical protein DH2020_023281 [Rehmannia glutinosa]|uniref:Uncharacterized protein n=1 Tax=Rehmannia glutinosa TaxID=99300 RepID=A0ABR0W5J6_REHGL